MKVNASRFVQALKRVAQAGRLFVHSMRDDWRFWRYAALSSFDSRYEQIVARIMYNVHALEKGLAQSEGWQPGRSRKALRNLNDALAGYRRQAFDETAYAFMQGVAIIQRYQERHAAAPDSVTFLPAIIDPAFLSPPNAVRFTGAGVKVVSRASKSNNAEKGFYALSQGRSSVRAFTGRPIRTEQVMNALRNAEKTPSVCNRQGWRVYWTEDKDLARNVLRWQGGFGYPQMPEVLLAITVSNSSFISPVERNQSFVDGGLFAMSVLYGLEAEGLGAVPLNACLYARNHSAIRELLRIDPSEELIMFIAVGEHPEETVVPKSDRRPIETYLLRRGAGD